MGFVGSAGQVLLLAAPIGNPRDASPRVVWALAHADVIAAEDTRRLRRLCADLAVTPRGRVVSFFDGNESVRTPELLEEVRAGQTVAVITDAGLPLLSDPGYRLVHRAAADGLPISCLPGPSAVTTALAVSGLAVDRFCFEGFLPRRRGQRRRTLSELHSEPRTMVFFEAPHRLHDTLADMAAEWGLQRRAVVCRELTKTHEEIIRGDLGNLVTWAADGVRGEVTLVVAGGGEASTVAAPETLVAAVRSAEAAGLSRKEAMAQVARTHDVARRAVFDALVAAKDDPRSPQ